MKWAGDHAGAGGAAAAAGVARKVLAWRGVSRSFGAVRALDRLSLEVRPGEIFGFLGPNGAGKTTALRIAVGLLRPHEGEVLLHGLPARASGSRRSVVYLPEEIRFSGPFRLGEWLRHQVALRRGDRGRCAEALERLGLAAKAAVPVRGLSKGMRRRAALALPLACRPDLWLLDEPTADLDVEGRELVENLLLEAKRGGATVFLSSHILSDVERVCDRVGVIHEGRLVRTATPAELIPKPHLVDLTLEAYDGDGADLAGARPHLYNREGRRLRVFVAGREEGEALIREIEERGAVVARSTFRPASLRDAVGSILS